MELSILYSRALDGIDAPLVEVETHLANGLPAFHIVGLPETAVRESKERVRSAIVNSHFDFPDRRITINLAPADLPKEGGRFDLAIALGILIASNQLSSNVTSGHEFIGELALNGALRPVTGVVSAAMMATQSNRKLAMPMIGADIAAQVPASQIIAAEDLLSLCAHLNQNKTIKPYRGAANETVVPYPDMSDVLGQYAARRALEVAACGGHNLLFTGPPGTGKTLLASRLPGILPPMSQAEALTHMALYSATQARPKLSGMQRPFRRPHHGASAAALVGGGSRPKPGEISLAHGGVLFLDELPEFPRSNLEMLREPMESGEITLSRVQHKTCYPARFQLIAAMNPCPCGYYGDSEIHCHCSPQQISRYKHRISAPLLDRIDIQIGVSRLPSISLLTVNKAGESTATVRERVIAARQRQLNRQNCNNSELPHQQLLGYCELQQEDSHFLQHIAQKLMLSARALHRCLRVARSIADLADSEAVGRQHINEAVAYRGNTLEPRAKILSQ